MASSRVVSVTTASILPGDGFEGEGQDSVVADDPAVLALFGGHPRGLSETHGNVFEPRLGASYQLNDKTVIRASGGIFHNRVPLNDSTLLGGNPPFQPQATVSNGSVDNPGGVGVNPGNLPIGITGQDPVFKHPTSYLWSTGVQREVPGGFIIDMTYVGRRGLYLQRERNINQLPLGTVNNPANPGVNIAALRPYLGYGVIRLSENAGRVHVQQPADLGRPPLHQRPQGRARPTRWASRPTTAPTSATCCGTPTTTRCTSGRRTSIAGTCSTSITSTTCRSSATRTHR